MEVQSGHLQGVPEDELLPGLIQHEGPMNDVPVFLEQALADFHGQLGKKEENTALAASAQEDQVKFEKSVAQMDTNIKTLRSTISKWENELRVLKSRVTVSNATKTINKQLAQIDSSGTVALLERMKEKVAVEEALAESYGEIANESRSIDQEIEKALESSSAQKSAKEVEALKAKLGFATPSEPQSTTTTPAE